MYSRLARRTASRLSFIIGLLNKCFFDLFAFFAAAGEKQQRQL
jgi:hypothetical protein